MARYAQRCSGASQRVFACRCVTFYASLCLLSQIGGLSTSKKKNNNNNNNNNDETAYSKNRITVIVIISLFLSFFWKKKCVTEECT